VAGIQEGATFNARVTNNLKENYLVGLIGENKVEEKLTV